MIHPVEYLKGVRKKTQIKALIKSHTWKDAKSKEKSRQLQDEFYFTIDMLILWNHNMELQKYYKSRIQILDSKLQSLLQLSEL